jgi:predicted ATPase/DNA-binding SARP family transcriptional activator
MAAYLQLFARPGVRMGEKWHSLKPKRPLKLLSFLALSEGWVSRDELLLLFWPDEDEMSARHNLRQLLYRCKALPWVSDLEIEEDCVRWQVASDVAAFQEALKRSDWEGALKHYQGEFLAAVQEDPSAEFESWLDAMRREFFESWQEAVLKVAAEQEGKGKLKEAAALLESALKHDDLAEEVVQAAMRVLALAGKPEEALRVYKSFSRRLQEELEMAPLEATQELARRIQAGELSAVTVVTEAPAVQGELPQFLNAFVGRALERAELVELIRERHLITLIGIGGIGKTRLALQLLEELKGEFQDGSSFIPLAPLVSAETVATTAATALGLSLTGKEQSEEELLNYLQDRKTLLLVDNFEHLLEAAGLVADILETSPKSKVLVTSREPLELPGETVYEVGGLALPVDEHNLEDYDAVQLFLRSARRSYADFALMPQDRPYLVRLVRLLEGSPLAIELASAWVRLLSLEELVEEISQNVHLLSADEPQRPERHRSLKAVFEHSWSLLSPEEQSVLAALSVFRGGFERAAAQEVAGASLRTLLVLVNKSLVRKVSPGRFGMLEVLRQLALEKLEDKEAVLRRHGEYFLALAEEAEPQLRDAEQVVWLERLETEHDNMRAALQWAQKNEADIGLRLVGSLWRFWHIRSYLSEGREWLARALAHPEAAERTSARAEALGGAGFLAWEQGDYAAARSLYEESLAISRELGDKQGVAQSLSYLGLTAYAQGDYAATRSLHEESLAISRELGDNLGIDISLLILGTVACEQGDYASARSLFEESLGLTRELKNKQGIAVSLHGLGDVAYEEGDYASARSFHKESLAIRRELGEKRSIAYSLEAFAALRVAEGEPREGARLYGAAQALREVLAAPLHPGERRRYERNMEAARARLDEERFRAAWADGRAMPLEEAIACALGGHLENPLAPPGRGFG